MEEKTEKLLIKELPENKTNSREPVLFKKKLLHFILRTGKKPAIYGLGIILFILIVTPIITYGYFVRDLSSKENIITRKNAGVILLDRNDKPFFTFYEARTKLTATLERIPDDIEHAVIAIEDKDFYEHPGFSIRGIARALITNISQEQLAQGGSTISQQLIKNTLLSQSKNFLRKYQEIVLALELERRYSKRDILEMYLNTVYFGEGAFGVEDAAKKYFNKSAHQLSLSECALLAGILPAPSALSPLSGDKDRAFRRRDLVLSEMKKQGFINNYDEQDAKDTPINFYPTNDGINETAPHFALMVKDELIKQYGEQQIAGSGFTVKTTLDLALQEFAETSVNNRVTLLTASKVTNGAAVILDPKTGEVISLVGSADWNDETNGKINMALRSRQPGSSFKPIVYAKAIEMRVLTPGSILDDKETIFPGNYKPKNYDGKFRGKVTVRRALANSLNIPAVKTIEKTGVSSVLEMAGKLGITTLKNSQQYGYSLALGSGEIPLLEMTKAFAVFANSGEKVKSTTILEISDKKGNQVFSNKVQSERVLDQNITFLISSILSDNTARAEVFGNSLTLSRPAAVKTGTTEDYRDSLTIGYTPSVTIGVWIGNNDNTPMNSVAGSTGAAPIWRALMEKYLAGKPVERFTPPFGVTQLTICKENGLRTEIATSSAYPEFFLRGTEPKENCGISPTPTTTETPTPQPSETPKPTEVPKPTATPIPTEIPVPTNQPTPTEQLLPTVDIFL